MLRSLKCCRDCCAWSHARCRGASHSSGILGRVLAAGLLFVRPPRTVMGCLQTAFSLKFSRISCPVPAGEVSLCLGAFRYRTLGVGEKGSAAKSLSSGQAG